MSATDITLTLLSIIGILQLVWMTNILHAKNIPNLRIRQTILPLLNIWILMWPIYNNPRIIFITLLLFAITPYLPLKWTRLFHTITHGEAQLWLQQLFALAIAATLFQWMPNAGFAVALAITLALPLVQLSVLFMRSPYLLAGLFSAVITAIYLWANSIYHIETALPIAVPLIAFALFLLIPTLGKSPAMALSFTLLFWYF
ncbi:MAG: hypothetical protein HQM07_05280 [Zetaproteobacteria bacterium]|nr:hypothetical protein [Zetaproteobacteria bacterium]